MNNMQVANANTHDHTEYDPSMYFKGIAIVIRATGINRNPNPKSLYTT